jgi:hypothetical protein
MEGVDMVWKESCGKYRSLAGKLNVFNVCWKSHLTGDNFIVPFSIGRQSKALRSESQGRI